MGHLLRSYGCFPPKILNPVRYLLPFLFGFASCFSAKIGPVQSDSQPISHQIWDDLLQEHVTPEGYVDYAGLQRDSVRFRQYLNLLSQGHPNDSNWTQREQLAYWYNAYNAFTVQLILDHYPVNSIKDIKSGVPGLNTVWDIKFIRIEGREYDLNNLEHGIVRPNFNEPRSHFALNCASISCPSLRNEAYVADRLDAQLDDQARVFLADPKKNFISPDAINVSKLFSWYGGDFTQDTDLIAYLNQYAPVRIQPDAKVNHTAYLWGLNTAANYAQTPNVAREDL